MGEPEFGWFARGDLKFTDHLGPNFRVSKEQILDALPFVARYGRFWMKYVRQKDVLFIDTFRQLPWKPHFGVPCGGIGCGSLGRDFRGGFRKFALRPGLVEHHVDIIPADQFLVTVRNSDSTLYQQALCAAPISTNQLNSWNFDFPPSNLTYHGLYPRSWTHYDLPMNERKVSLSCRQVSPVLPQDYKNSCLPVTVFIWDVCNETDEPLDISLTFTFRNGTGDSRWRKKQPCFADVIDEQPVAKGMSLKHKIDDMDCCYTIMAENKAGQTITYRTFNPAGNGSKLWTDLLNDGQLDTKCKGFLGRYTRWFGDDLNAGPVLARYALENVQKWEEAIQLWQNPILNHKQLPSWYKSAIFNELYFLTDGGTIWVEYEDSWTTHEPHLSEYAIELMREWGRFAYLESWEYRMLNTYDVHFYASFSLALLYPKLEQCLQIEFTCQLFSSDNTLVKYFYDGQVAPAKTLHRVPHDLGSPGIGLLTSLAEDPWLCTNAYLMHNTGEWRDLNLKYILMSYRDMVHICPEDQRFREEVWPAIKIIIEDCLSKWDEDGDCCIENSGTCDQTYDAWKMKGISAYCGGLWLASLRVAQEFAGLMGEGKLSKRYAHMLATASASYDKKLWNGEYYNFDQFSKRPDTIMADQLCGYWFLKLTHPSISEELFPPGRVDKCLDVIYKMNVMGFADGKMGAVNGMQPNGKKDRICVQAEEVWTGVTYALASLMLQKGRSAQGFLTAGGMHSACFGRLGLQYQTPEAIYEKHSYRAVGYMRPLAIWAMQWALLKQHHFPHLPIHKFPLIAE